MSRRSRSGFRGLEEIRKCVGEELGSKPENFCQFFEALSEEAYEIADHLRSNWQDARSALRALRVAEREFGRAEEHAEAARLDFGMTPEEKKEYARWRPEHLEEDLERMGVWRISWRTRIRRREATKDEAMGEQPRKATRVVGRRSGLPAAT